MIHLKECLLKERKKKKNRSDEWLSLSKVYSIYDNFSNFKFFTKSVSKVYSIYDNFSNFKFFTKSVCNKINIIKVKLLNILSMFNKVT